MSLPPIFDRVLAAFAADPNVSEAWLGGSYARGDADSYSDVDLCLRATAWDPTRLGGLWLAGQVVSLGGHALYSGILTDGTMLDLLMQEPHEGYLSLDFPNPEPPPPGRPDPSGLTTDFWLNSYKHRKVFGRGLWAMATFGIHQERTMLLRLWALAATGSDPGARMMTIHGMTPYFRELVRIRQMELLGAPGRDPVEMRATIEALRDEVARVGRMIENRWGIPYPHRLETLVRERPVVDPTHPVLPF